MTAAKIQATAIAAVAATAGGALVTAAQPVANPAIAALGGGLEAGVGASYLTNAIGPLGEALAGPLVAVVIDLGEEKALAVAAAMPKAD